MTAPGIQALGIESDRCSHCYLHVSHGHRSEIDGVPTGCNDSGPLGLKLARERRDRGMKRTVEAHPDDRARIDAVLSRFIGSGRPFSANDTRPHLSGVKGSVIGARFQAAARAGRMKRTGERVTSTDPGTHAHRIDEWIGVAA